MPLQIPRAAGWLAAFACSSCSSNCVGLVRPNILLLTQVRAAKSKGYELHARRAKGVELKRRHGRWQQV